MDPSQPLVLDYRSPQSDYSLQRRLAAQTARISGTVFVAVAFMALLCGTALFGSGWGKSPLTRGRENQRLVIMLGVYALTYLASGLVIYFGGAKIRTPRPVWEHLIVVVSRVQIAFACCMASAAAYGMFITPHRDTIWISAIFVGIHLVILWRLMVIIRRIRVLDRRSRRRQFV
jgi:hypothetical protein